MSKGKIIVPASAIKIKSESDDDDYYDDNDDSCDEVSGRKIPCFNGLRALYMTFAKRTAKKRHYII